MLNLPVNDQQLTSQTPQGANASIDGGMLPRAEDDVNTHFSLVLLIRSRCMDRSLLYKKETFPAFMALPQMIAALAKRKFL